MQSYHWLVKSIPGRPQKQERKFIAEFNIDKEVLSTIASTEMIGILQPTHIELFLRLSAWDYFKLVILYEIDEVSFDLKSTNEFHVTCKE